MKTIKFIAPLLSAFVLAACTGAKEDSATTETTVKPETLHIYSARHYDSDKLLYEAFEKASGVRVLVREANANQLLETLKAEGDKSPADIVIASDAGALWRFQSAGLTQPVQSEALDAAIPQAFRQADGHWFGAARRLRLVAYDPDRISADQVDTWNDLADPALKNEICVRSSSNIYNLSLMGEMIARIGSDSALEWASKVTDNMARSPQGGDTDQIKAVAAGECSVAITNHYYWVRMAESKSSDDRAAAGKTALSVPAFSDGAGAHVNITGAAVMKTAENPERAAQFIAFLLTDEGQALLTTETKELPLLDTTPRPAGADRIPPFEAGTTPLEAFGENQTEAQRLYDLAGWN